MEKTGVYGLEAVCFWLKQLVSGCTNHCTHCTRLYGEDCCGTRFGGLANYSFVGTRFLIPINGFCHCAINGENRVLGFEAVCFGLKQAFGNCSAIDRHWSEFLKLIFRRFAEKCVLESLGKMKLNDSRRSSFQEGEGGR